MSEFNNVHIISEIIEAIYFKNIWIMYFFADFLVLGCLFVSGHFFGYYCKFVYIYDNLYHHWYALLGMIIALALAVVWTLQKYYRRQYCFNHFYIIFYGLICSVISSCFMLSDNLDISFYFGFIGLGIIYMSSFSFINLRCTSKGLRPMRIALGNTFYFIGLSVGFLLFNEFEPTQCGWIYLGLTLVIISGTVITEILQYTNIQCYKKSCDLVFDLMNEEKFIFLSTKSVYSLFTDRPEFYFDKNRQWLVVGLSSLIVLERIFLFSPSYLQLTWSSIFGYLSTQYLYGPFLFHTVGCAFGTVLMIRYKPKLLYLMFGLIKITALSAILGVYADDRSENCFYFLCFYYISMGVYSSIALQMILECTPFLYTELGLALAFVIQLSAVELLKYESYNDGSWELLLGIGISSIVLTGVCLLVIQLFLPPSEGLIEMRNRLLGIRRHSPVIPQTKIWNSNYFLHHDMQPNEFSNVTFDGNRTFQQYPGKITSENKRF